jgi:hypothetical protein
MGEMPRSGEREEKSTKTGSETNVHNGHPDVVINARLPVFRQRAIAGGFWVSIERLPHLKESCKGFPVLAWRRLVRIVGPNSGRNVC